jgi:hypothetical protein
MVFIDSKLYYIRSIWGDWISPSINLYPKPKQTYLTFPSYYLNSIISPSLGLANLLKVVNHGPQGYWAAIATIHIELTNIDGYLSCVADANVIFHKGRTGKAAAGYGTARKCSKHAQNKCNTLKKEKKKM